jgi:hypothetical protein
LDILYKGKKRKQAPRTKMYPCYRKVTLQVTQRDLPEIKEKNLPRLTQNAIWLD